VSAKVTLTYDDSLYKPSKSREVRRHKSCRASGTAGVERPLRAYQCRSRDRSEDYAVDYERDEYDEDVHVVQDVYTPEGYAQESSKRNRRGCDSFAIDSFMCDDSANRGRNDRQGYRGEGDAETTLRENNCDAATWNGHADRMEYSYEDTTGLDYNDVTQDMERVTGRREDRLKTQMDKENFRVPCTPTPRRQAPVGSPSRTNGSHWLTQGIAPSTLRTPAFPAYGPRFYDPVVVGCQTMSPSRSMDSQMNSITASMNSTPVDELTM